MSDDNWRYSNSEFISSAFEFAVLNPLRLKVYDTAFVKQFLVSDQHCWELDS
jgi:hypothetical protein